ncbi:MAG: uncharacterized membrane protein YtjA (UPF0391 family) [Zhongshania sp.]|jgi:uncharacterized membrane protein YtjA (UPF0391 family)
MSELSLQRNKEIIMLGWSLVFFLVAIASAALGFGGIAGTAAGIAKILFFIFLALLVISLVMQILRGRPPRL